MARPETGRKSRGTGVSLRPDTVVGESGGEGRSGVYVGEMPGCCLAIFKDGVRGDDVGLDGVVCGCGRGWAVISSLDERVLEKFRVGSESRRAG